MTDFERFQNLGFALYAIPEAARKYEKWCCRQNKPFIFVSGAVGRMYKVRVLLFRGWKFTGDGRRLVTEVLRRGALGLQPSVSTKSASAMIAPELLQTVLDTLVRLLADDEVRQFRPNRRYFRALRRLDRLHPESTGQPVKTEFTATPGTTGDQALAA